MIALALVQTPPEPSLSGAGLFFAIAAWVVVSGLLAWCFWRGMGGPKSS